MPLVRNPQPWSQPASTAVNTPLGGSSWTSKRLPQQAMVPFVRKPHENQSAVVTAVNRPDGGLA